jgi:hypothetical protein
VHFQGAFRRVSLQGGGSESKLIMIRLFLAVLIRSFCVYISVLSHLRVISYLLCPCTFLPPHLSLRTIFGLWVFLRDYLNFFAVTIRHIFSWGCERIDYCAQNINQLKFDILPFFDIFFYVYFKCQIPSYTGIFVSDAVGNVAI